VRAGTHVHLQARRIDTVVWEVVATLLHDPTLLAAQLAVPVPTPAPELAVREHLLQQVAQCDHEETRWDDAYACAVISLEKHTRKLEEIQRRRRDLQARVQALTGEEAAALRPPVMPTLEALCTRLQAWVTDPPTIEVQQRVLERWISSCTMPQGSRSPSRGVCLFRTTTPLQAPHSG